MRHHYPPGTVLYDQAQVLRYVYRLDNGLVKILNRRHSGQEVVVALRVTGSSLGLTATILGRPTCTTAVALTACSVTAVPAATLVQRLWSDPTLLRDVVTVQSAKTHEYLNRLSLLTCVPARHGSSRHVGETHWRADYTLSKTHGA